MYLTKKLINVLLVAITLSIGGCGVNNEDTNIIGGADEPTSIVLEPTAENNESLSKEEFDLDDIQINKLPKKIYDYSKEGALDFEKNYVRLEAIAANGLKIYGVGDNEQKTVLLVNKDKSFYTGWATDPGIEIYSYSIFDYDADGEDELAICTNEDAHHNNLFVVELSDDKLWQYRELDCFDESIDKYIWEHLSYIYDKEGNAIIFVSDNGRNTITFTGDALPDNCAETMSVNNIEPETSNERRLYLGGQVLSDRVEEGPLLSIPIGTEAKAPNFTEYQLNEGDLVMSVSIDYVQGANYGEAFIKLAFDEDGITFSGFDFLNNTDKCY